MERLPEPNPLAEPLPGLVAARDRAAFAREHDLEYRDGEVKVFIELKADGNRPDQYLSTVVGEQGQTLVAYVDVDDLVDLATDDNVRIVRPPSEPKTHDGTRTDG